LSSAQLAAAHAVSGGIYEYGYLYLGPQWGFTASWLFLCAKSASAATSALGVAGYFLHAVGLTEPSLGVPLALIALEAFVANELPNTGLVVRGSGAIGRGEWQ
jgi:basic amino acid/polyamine antiporter, APA family